MSLLLPLISLLLFLLMTFSEIFAAKSSAIAAPTSIISELDPISFDCIACHDGSMGPHIRFSLPSQKDLGMWGGGHIVSVSYAERAARISGLRPMNSLPPELVLYQGKITCVTCHGSDPHLTRMLVIDNLHSALCRSCHLK